MSDFGDWDPEDALDREPADPEQVTYKLHRLRFVLDQLAGTQGLPVWEELEPEAQELALGIGEVIVRFIREREPDDAVELARHLHNARRYVASSRLPAWEELSADDRQVGVDLMSVLILWLARQGALA